MVPIGGEMGMNCAVLTYDGTAFFGFTGDAHAIPDLRVLDKLLSTSFAELLKAVGVRQTRPSRKRAKPQGKPVPATAKSAANAAKVLVAPETIAAPAKSAREPEAKAVAGQQVISLSVGGEETIASGSEPSPRAY